MKAQPHSSQPLEPADALPLNAAQIAIASAQQASGPSSLYWTAQYLELGNLGEQPAQAPDALESTLKTLLAACDALHLQPELSEQGWRQHRRDKHVGRRDKPLGLRQKPLGLSRINCTSREKALAHCQAQLQRKFSWGNDLYICQIVQLPTCTWVYLQVHHLAFDGYSYTLFWQALCSHLANPQLPMPNWDIAPLVTADQALRKSPAHQARVQALAARLHAPVPVQAFNPLGEISRAWVVQGEQLALVQVQAAATQVNLSWPQWLACACAWVLQQLGWTHQRPLGLVNMARRGPQARVPLMCMGLQALPCPQAQSLADFIPLFVQELTAWQQNPQVRWEELAPPGFSQPLGACVNLLLFPQILKCTGFNLRLSTLAQGPVQQLNLNIQVIGEGLELQALIPSHWQPQAAEQTLDALARLLVNPAANLHISPHHLVGPKAPAPIDLLARLWQQKTRTPEADAFCNLAGERTSYRSLYRQVVSLSEQLRARGVASGERVALWALPGFASLKAMLAIGFTEASYLPLDPKSGPDRLSRQLAAAGVKWLLAPQQTLPELRQALTSQLPIELLNLDELLGAPESSTPCKAPPSWAPEREAYVLFTSGSSGEPKGVVMNWGAYGQFLASAQQAYQPPLAARWLMFANLSFDASLEEIGLCLSHGGCLVERPEPCDFASLNALIRRQGINVLDLPTAYWHQWIESHPAPQPSLALTIIGGEALCPERLKTFSLLPGLGRLINSYGPTEACIVACWEELTPLEKAGPPAQPADDRAASTPAPSCLGRPLPGMGALVLNNQGQPLGPGQIGELYLFGPQLAQGYLDQAQTRQRFVPPAPAWQLPGPLYATGDLAAVNEDGRLEFFGRNDDEVKLDGQRINLQALTQAHLAEPTIHQAALWLERRCNPPRVMAALVLKPACQLDTQSLKARLAEHWPAAALPSRYLVLDQLPLNSRGKTDWAALARGAEEPPSAAHQRPGGNQLRQQLKQLWHGCLGSTPAPNDDFWQAGGRSLTALILAQHISALLGCAFAAQHLYANPRFNDLCDLVEQMAPRNPPRATAANRCLFPGIPSKEGQLTLYACAPIDGGVEVYRPLGAACGLPLWGLPTANLSLGTSARLGEARPSEARPGEARPFDHWVQEQCQWLLGRPGTIVLLGWSSGGSLALALAAALAQAGRAPAGVLLLDAYPPQCWQAHPAPTMREALLNLIDVPEGLDPNRLTDEQLLHWLARPDGSYPGLSARALEPLVAATLAQMQHFRRWRFAPYAGSVHYLAAALTAGPVPHRQALLGAASGPVHWHSIEATHLGLLDAAHIPSIAAFINQLTQEAEYAYSH